MVSNSLNIEVGDFLKVKRNSHKMQQKDFIKVINLSPAVVSRLEKGISPLTEKMAHRLDEAYGDTEVSDYLASVESKRSGMNELVDLLQENYQSLDADAINTLRSFTKFMMNLKNPESNYKVEVVAEPPPKASPSGSWSWIKRELKNELMLLNVPINRVHISRSKSIDIGGQRIWDTETEMFTQMATEYTADEMKTITPITRDLLDVVPNGGLVTWEQLKGMSHNNKESNAYTRSINFLFGEDQIIFLPLDNTLDRRVFLTISGPSFNRQQFDLIKAAALSFISKFM